MAKCPKCKKTWLWDWEQDVYTKPRGEMCKEIDFTLEDTDEDITVYQCDCGKVLGVMSHTGEVTTIKEWKKIDWDTDEHRFVK